MIWIQAIKLNGKGTILASITAEAGSHNYPFHYWNTSHSYTGRIPAAATSAIPVAATAALKLKCPSKQMRL